MIGHVLHLEKIQPIVYGVNCGPAAVFVAGSMWACDGIFRPYVSTRLNAGARQAMCSEEVCRIVPPFFIWKASLVLIFLVQTNLPKGASTREWG